jgi:hypothetical protein
LVTMLPESQRWYLPSSLHALREFRQDAKM